MTLHTQARRQAEFAEIGFASRALIRKYSDHISGSRCQPVAGLDSDDVNVAHIQRNGALDSTRSSEVSQTRNTMEFYKHLSHDFTDPLRWSHNRVEGKREYTSLLFHTIDGALSTSGIERRRAG